VRRALASQALLKVLDQALSSTVNLLGSVFAAWALDVEEFGAFGLLVAAYLASAGLGRAVAGDALLLRGEPGGTGPTGGAVGAAALVGVVCGALVAAVGLVLVDGTAADGVLVLSVLLPLLLVQDSLRYVAYLDGRALHAAASSAGWVVLSLLAMLLLAQTSPSLPQVVAAWAVPGAVVGVATLRLYRRQVQPRQVLPWFIHTRRLTPPLLGDYVIVAIAQQGLLYAVTWTTGLSGAAAVRGALVLLGPINVLVAGASTSLVPRIRFSAVEGRAALLRACASASGVLVVSAAVSGAVVLVLGPVFGQLVLGRSWSVVAPVLPYSAVALSLFAATVAPITGVRVLGRAGSATALAAVLLAPTSVAFVVGAALDGARGAVIGQCLVAAVGLVAWWLLLARLSARLGDPHQVGA